MNKKVSILLIDKTWLEGILKERTSKGIILTDVFRAHDGEASGIPIARKVFVPWSSILYEIQEL